MAGSHAAHGCLAGAARRSKITQDYGGEAPQVIGSPSILRTGQDQASDAFASQLASGELIGGGSELSPSPTTPSGAIDKKERYMSTLQESNKAVVRRFNKDFVETGDRAIYNEIVSAEFTNHSVHGNEPTDREASFFFFTAIFRTAFPNVKVVIHDQFADGDTVITRKSYQGTHTGSFMDIPGTGKQVDISVIEIVRLRDGKYVDHWATADMLGLLQQLKAA